MIRIAIVGTGNISRAHIESYLTFPNRAKIVAMVDIVPGKARAKAIEFGIECDDYTCHGDILGRDDIDVIDVCTPPYAHAQIAIDAMNAGKHVIVEKPMAASLEECDRMIETAKRTGVVFSSIAQNRFRTPIANLKAMLDSGLAGPIKHAQIDSFWWRGHSYYDLWWRGLWDKEGGGCTLNHAVHHIDMLGWMMGLPEEITAVMANVSHDNAEVEDLSVAIMRYPASLATVTSSVVHHGEEQQLIFQCADACISAPYRAYASISKPNGFPTRNEELEEKLTALNDSLPEIEYEGHPGQIDDILSAIEQGREPAITGLDGRRTIELITGIYKSGATGAAAKLPIDKGDPFYTAAGMMASVPHFYEKLVAKDDLGDDIITIGSDYKA